MAKPLRVAEPPATWLTDTHPPPQGDLPDLNVWLAATAQAAGLRLVTFDADFARFQLPRWTQLQP